MNGDINNKCIYIQGGTIKNIKHNMVKNGLILNDTIVTKNYFDTGINEKVYGFLHVVIGDYLFQYIAVKRVSLIGRDTEVDYAPAFIYDCSNSDTLKLVKMSGVDNVDEWGLDQEIIEQILSECTEV